MTVATTTNRTSAVGNGVTVAFTTPRFNLDADIKVLLVTAAGVETLQSITTHYALAGAGDASGTCTFVTAPASGVKVIIYTDPSLTQGTDWIDYTDPAAVQELAFDKLTLIVQRLASLINRAIRQPEGDTVALSALPAAITRASKLLGFDETGLLQLYNSTGLTVPLPVAQGGTGAATAQAAMAALKGVYVLASSAVAVSCGADTTEDTLATITVPANAMGPNGRLRITTGWTVTNSANNKIVRVRLGGTEYSNFVLTTSATLRMLTGIANRNATNSQTSDAGSGVAGYGAQGTAMVNTAIDTTQAVNIVITGQKANAGETLTLESYLVELIRP